MKGEHILSGFVGTLSLLIGGWDFTMQVLMILMGVDVLTGVFKAIYYCRFSSKDFRQGLVSKAGFIIILILCYQLDVLMGNSDPVIRTVGAVFYISIEGSSIIENLGECGVPIPNFISKRLTKLKDLTNNETDLET